MSGQKIDKFNKPHGAGPDGVGLDGPLGDGAVGTVGTDGAIGTGGRVGAGVGTGGSGASRPMRARIPALSSNGGGT